MCKILQHKSKKKIKQKQIGRCAARIFSLWGITLNMYEIDWTPPKPLQTLQTAAWNMTRVELFLRPEMSKFRAPFSSKSNRDKGTKWSELNSPHPLCVANRIHRQVRCRIQVISVVPSEDTLIKILREVSGVNHDSTDASSQDRVSDVWLPVNETKRNSAKLHPSDLKTNRRGSACRGSNTYDGPSSSHRNV